MAAILVTVQVSHPDQHPPRLVSPEGDGPHLRVVGEVETVFDWSKDSCGPGHFADLPVRAFRDADDVVHLIISHTETRRMSGPDLSRLSVPCDVIMRSTQDPDPARFAFKEWIGAVYSEDGKTVHALVHNEFQGNAVGQAACTSRDYFKCWYNSVTYTRSTDGGATFTRPITPPDHLVASIPHRYQPDAGIFGVFSPSNIIAHDGQYYAYVKAQVPPDGAQHVCLIRTDQLDDPRAWRFRSVLGFDGQFIDPFRDTEASTFLAQCDPISLPEIAQMYESITWNTVLKKFVLVGTSSDPRREPNLFGFYYAFSDDLVTWEHRKPLLEVRLPWRVSDPNVPVYMYPTLIDADSPSRNFETTGASMHLYFTRLNTGQSGLDRDLVRVRVDVVP
ncbi:hypothetical protein [Aliiroseovarius subalbicans]|uniref:hypothetical protein n=1 Tax=Aliiroseovarius subalbicans TaxID=2925840 RepID=UPI001F57FF42|nr:hypothetical protein [Aliiroseovarius subalbicans]MCI2398465.1 hypothetical protein [Aliiroseovarius subalbicans]